MNIEYLYCCRPKINKYYNSGLYFLRTRTFNLGFEIPNPGRNDQNVG